MGSLFKDIRFGVRAMAKNPGLALIAVITLTLGIGLTTTMYSIVEGALRQLPFYRADRLMHLERNNLAQGEKSLEVPIHDFLDWREQQKSFEALAAFYQGTVNVSGPEDRPERFDGAFISANGFDLLHQTPLFGRNFREGEDVPGAPPVVILGYRLWKNRFHSDPEMVGKTIRVNAEQTTVVGIMPEGFLFPVRETVWLPLREDITKLKRGEGQTLEVYGRLKDGVSLDQARAELAAIAKRIEDANPDTNKGIGSVLKPYTEEFVGEEAISLLYTMLGAVFGVLLIACANVANLLLARTVLRSKEVAIRSALGASRRQIVSQMLTESLLLSAVGALLGLGIAALGIRLFNNAIAPTDPPFWIDIRIDWKVLAFVATVTVATAVLSGLLPALQASGSRVNEVLKDESRGSAGFRLGRFSKVLVVVEIALSCGLLVASGLMIKSLTNLRTIDYGFATKDVFTARLGLFEKDYPDAAHRQQFFDALQERVAALPGVHTVAIGSTLPVRGSERPRVMVEGHSYAREEDQPRAHRADVSSGYFGTFRVALTAGRDFAASDRADSLPVAIVNRSFADKLFPNESPIGHRIQVTGANPPEPWRTIVGVVPDLYMDGLQNKEPVGFYAPLAQSDDRFVSLAANVAGDPMALAPAVRDAVVATDPNLPIYWVWTMEESIARENWFYGIFGTLFMVFGGVALFLAAVGLYGVMAFSVSRRTHEVGIRMALGAQARDVLRMILRQGMVQLAIGMLGGLGLAFGLARLLKILLFRVEPWDPSIFFGIATLLAATGLLACLLPALRAARVDPLVAMRVE